MSYSWGWFHKGAIEHVIETDGKSVFSYIYGDDVPFGVDEMPLHVEEYFSEAAKDRRRRNTCKKCGVIFVVNQCQLCSWEQRMEEHREVIRIKKRRQEKEQEYQNRIIEERIKAGKIGGLL